MMNFKSLPFSAVLLVSLTSVGQQTPSTSQPTPVQAQPAAASTAPCNKSAPDPQHKPGWLEKKARALACAHDKGLCDLPKSPDDALGTPTGGKPCPANPATSATVKPQAQPTPTPPAVPALATTSNKPVLVCPPKASLIPGFPYCLNPDRSVVDAIALPPSLSAPAPPVPAAPAQAQH
jgi:hypothetical protein